MKEKKIKNRLPDCATYSQGELNTSNPIVKFIKRLGRKITFWYVNPFGEKQNEFNKAAADAISQLIESKADDETIKAALADERSYAAKNFSIISRSYEEMTRRINELEERLDNESKKRIEGDAVVSDKVDRLHGESGRELNSYARIRHPEYRMNAPFSDCLDIGSEFTNAVTRELCELPESEIDADTWSANYTRAMKYELFRVENDAAKKIIAVVCKRYMQCMDIEAVRSEALDLYRLLKEKSVYNIKMISIEPDLSETVKAGEVTCIPEKGAGNYIAGLNPLLCVFCESSPHIIRSDGCSMIMNRSLFKLSGQNPLQEISDSTLAELVHLSDLGLHRYIVQSEKAAEIMTEKGFREPMISYPVIRGAKLLPRKRIFDKKSYTVGFASSPMDMAQADDRGIGLLCEAVEAAPDISFEILWRYDSAVIPSKLRECSNCRIIYGKYDMTAFYSEIDCLLIPYKTINCNHACSLSAVEAMLNGIPVVCTDVSGVSEVVSGCGIGEVTSPDSNGLVKALRLVADRYSIYLSPVNKKRLDAILDNDDIVSIIESEAEKQLPVRPVTLFEWDRRLRLNGKYLVKGHDAMKEYYQQQEVADKYTEVRFTSRALKYFDMLERCNIGIILESRFGEQRPRILDLACGDGRITSECIKHGSCVSADASDAMLGIVNSRFENCDNKPETRVFDIITDEPWDKFDAVTCFRYVRHFEYNIRRILYKKFAESLNDGGLLIMDVPNIDFELRLKSVTGWENYNIYDVFWTKERIIEELSANGFEVRYIIPTGEGLMTNMPEDMQKMPMTWTIGAVRAPRPEN